MGDGGQREPLWADWLKDQPPAAPGVVRPEPVLHEEPADLDARPRRGVAVLVTLAVVLTALGLADRGSLRAEDLPSYWGDVPMTCETLRFDQDGRAIEWFRCHALAAHTLPPGRYTSPRAQWTSDITRRDAARNEIEISRDGELTGWALYP